VVNSASSPPIFTWRHVALLLVGPLALALAGSTHPADLTSTTAGRWYAVHLVMLPLFPLLAANVWVLLRGIWSGVDGALAVAARVLAFSYAVFYTALDVLAGIATGALVTEATSSGMNVAGPKALMFREGNHLAGIGALSMLAASVLVAVVLVRRYGRVALPGALILVASSVSFLDSHVYPVRGVITMLGFGAGAVLLALPGMRTSRPSTHADPALHAPVGAPDSLTRRDE